MTEENGTLVCAADITSEKNVQMCPGGPVPCPLFWGAVLRAQMLASGHPALSPDSAAWAAGTAPAEWSRLCVC